MEKGNKSEEIQTTINHAPLHSWSFAHSYSYCLKLKKHRNKATEKMMSQTDDSEWIFLSARASMDICLNHSQIFSRRHNSCTWRESPRRRRVSDRSEVLRAGRQKLLLKIEIVGFFGFPIWNYLCKLEWSGKGTAVAEEWAVLQYKNTKQFQRQSYSQISG